MKKSIAVYIFLAFSIGLFLVSCNDNPYQQGEMIYLSQCANCHMEDGSGLEGNIPPLANADYIADDPYVMVCITKYGMEGEITVNGIKYNQPMEGIEEITDFQITNLINYINNAWGNDYGLAKVQEVRKRLEACDR